LILKDNNMSKHQDLVEFLVNINFDFVKTAEESSKIHKKISGMTAGEIIKCMEEAKVILKELQNTPVGKELL